MAKSYVLKALRLLSLDEVVKLAKAITVKPSLMKKAAGQELISWSDAAEEFVPIPEPEVKVPENVLPFNKIQRKPSAPDSSPAEARSESPPAEDGDMAHFVSTDFILWQRELSRDPSNGIQTKEAMKGYAKATEMYVVKTPASDGKDKIRFASTQGVLVNKKQA